MIDSWGKIPAGIFTLNLNSLGQFKECINIEHAHIKGKYCLAEFTFDPLLIIPQTSNETEGGNQRCIFSIYYKCKNTCKN